MSDVTLEILETIERNAEGFMIDPNAWTEEIARALALEEGLELTDRHWIVINYARAEFAKNGEAPTLRRITKQTDVGMKEIYQLFPDGPAKRAAKVAGLGKPTGCI